MTHYPMSLTTTEATTLRCAIFVHQEYLVDFVSKPGIGPQQWAVDRIDELEGIACRLASFVAHHAHGEAAV